MKPNKNIIILTNIFFSLSTLNMLGASPKPSNVKSAKAIPMPHESTSKPLSSPKNTKLYNKKQTADSSKSVTCESSTVKNEHITRESLQLSQFTFKNDSYAKKRGESSMLIISCSGCNQYIMSYQKDGPGLLLRCYLDRIHHPEYLEKRQHEAFNKKTSPKLECTSCQVVIGSPMIYESEKRPAYNMRSGFFYADKLNAKK